MDIKNFTGRNMSKFLFILLALLCVGCSSIQIHRVLFGLSKNDVQTIDAKRSQIVSMSADECYGRLPDIFKRIGAYILSQDKKNYFITGNNFKSEPPTTASTEVGILIEAIDAGTCKVIVCSESRAMADYAATKIFEQLKK